MVDFSQNIKIIRNHYYSFYIHIVATRRSLGLGKIVETRSFVVLNLAISLNERLNIKDGLNSQDKINKEPFL